MNKITFYVPNINVILVEVQCYFPLRLKDCYGNELLSLHTFKKQSGRGYTAF